MYNDPVRNAASHPNGFIEIAGKGINPDKIMEDIVYLLKNLYIFV